MTAILAFSFAAAITYFMRSSVTLAGAAASAPRIGPWLALVSPAVLMALVASSLVLDHGTVVVPHGGETLAIVLAAVAVRVSGNVSMALAVGLPVYWLTSALGLG